MATTYQFYITLFSNALREIYEQNTHADFTVKLAQHIDLCSNSNWELGLWEISISSSPHMGEDVTPLIHCNLVSPQSVGDNTVRSKRTFVLPSSSSCQYEFQNVYYVPIEQRQFEDVRISCGNFRTSGLSS